MNNESGHHNADHSLAKDELKLSLPFAVTDELPLNIRNDNEESMFS